MQKNSYLELIDTHTQGNRCDVTPIFSDPRAFFALVDDLAALCSGLTFDFIAGIDALGFILASALSSKLEKPFVPVRKGGKLPVPVDRQYFVDYSGTEKALEIRKDALAHFSRSLLVDEWIETGSQVGAAANLIEGQGAQVAGILSISIDNSTGVKALRARYPMFSVSEDL